MSDSNLKPEVSEDAAQRARREFLQKAGKFAAYTPPIMLALMYPGAHAIASGYEHRRRRGDQNGQGDNNDNQ